MYYKIQIEHNKNNFNNKRIKLIFYNENFIFEAKIMLNDFYKVTEIDEKEFVKVTDDVETLAGLILEIRGEIPQKNEKITFYIWRD